MYLKTKSFNRILLVSLYFNLYKYSLLDLITLVIIFYYSTSLDLWLGNSLCTQVTLIFNQYRITIVLIYYTSTFVDHLFIIYSNCHVDGYNYYSITINNYSQKK